MQYSVVCRMTNPIDINMTFTVQKEEHAYQLAKLAWDDIEVQWGKKIGQQWGKKIGHVQVSAEYECGWSVVAEYSGDSAPSEMVVSKVVQKMYDLRKAASIDSPLWRVLTKQAWLQAGKMDAEPEDKAQYFEHPQDALSHAQGLCIREAQDAIIQVSMGWKIEGRAARIWQTSHKYTLEVSEDYSEAWGRLFAYVASGVWYSANEDGTCHLTGRTMQHNPHTPAYLTLTY